MLWHRAWRQAGCSPGHRAKPPSGVGAAGYCAGDVAGECGDRAGRPRSMERGELGCMRELYDPSVIWRPPEDWPEGADLTKTFTLPRAVDLRVSTPA
jgi:hypothetical protein